MNSLYTYTFGVVTLENIQLTAYSHAHTHTYTHTHTDTRIHCYYCSITKNEYQSKEYRLVTWYWYYQYHVTKQYSLLYLLQSEFRQEVNHKTLTRKPLYCVINYQNPEKGSDRMRRIRYPQKHVKLLTHQIQSLRLEYLISLLSPKSHTPKKQTGILMWQNQDLLIMTIMPMKMWHI